MNRKERHRATSSKTFSHDQNLQVDAENLKHRLAENPQCPHGPSLLFHRTTKNASSSSATKSFYSCSAFRDKKRCRFYMEFSSSQSKSDRARKRKLETTGLDVDSSGPLQNTAKTDPSEYRRNQANGMMHWCKACEKLIPSERITNHKHPLEKVDSRFPTRFLPALKENPGEAQYFFNDRTKTFLLDLLQSHRAKTVLCIGCPRLHEEILASTSGLSSFLLDIDARFGDFFPRESFAHYNMFNHHFFDPAGHEAYLNFIKDKDARDMTIIMDPPFAGIVQVLANTLERLFADMGKCTVMWIFPYYMEKHITREAPYLSMISYSVEYDNHAKLRNKSANDPIMTRGSPIRIFTNMPPELIQLPTQEGYWYCQSCRKFSSCHNTHCFLCGVCPSKDGKAWRHCEKCGRCVKGDWKHCNRCQRCHSKGCLYAKSGGK